LSRHNLFGIRLVSGIFLDQGRFRLSPVDAASMDERGLLDHVLPRHKFMWGQCAVESLRGAPGARKAGVVHGSLQGSCGYLFHRFPREGNLMLFGLPQRDHCDDEEERVLSGSLASKLAGASLHHLHANCICNGIFTGSLVDTARQMYPPHQYPSRNAAVSGQLFSVGLPMPYPVRVTQQWSVNRWGLEVDGQVCEVWVMVVLVTAAGSQSQHTGLISLFFPRLGKGDISWHLYFQSMSF